jgi:hypothetical protein
MNAPRKTSLEAFRARQRRKGLVRVEVQVQKEDAALLRSVVQALGDPQRGDELRSALKLRLAPTGDVDLKALLASAPLDGIDLDRSRDLGRPLAL